MQLVAANKKKPFIFGLTLPGDVPCPLGEWLADRISQSLTQAHSELEVVPRELIKNVPVSSEFLHDRNQELMANDKRALAAGAQILIHGNFAAISNGIGVTLIADDRLAGGNSRFEALGELSVTAEMQAQIRSALPERPSLDGTFKASIAGIGSAICEQCPAPEYTYVAQAKRLSGVVILQLWVSSRGDAENARIVRTPNPTLAEAAARAVRNWHFKPARNASGEFVPVVVDVAVSFRLNAKQLDASAEKSKSIRSD